MRKQDYMSPAYTKSEWRHCLAFTGCQGIQVFGLEIAGSGGDGIYVGRGTSMTFCDTVHIKDVVCENNLRQGISVISARDLLIEDCVFRQTKGAAPESGIDFEPNERDEQLVGCVVRNCEILDNANLGVQIVLANLDRDSHPISITIEGSRILGNMGGTLEVWPTKSGDGELGYIRISRNVFDMSPYIPPMTNVRVLIEE